MNFVALVMKEATRAYCTLPTPLKQVGTCPHAEFTLWVSLALQKVGPRLEPINSPARRCAMESAATSPSETYAAAANIDADDVEPNESRSLKVVIVEAVDPTGRPMPAADDESFLCLLTGVDPDGVDDDEFGNMPGMAGK